jgi:hypothetical protein
MSAALLADLRSRGIELQTDGARIRWRPREAVGPDLRDAILANRDALIALLSGPGAAPAAACPRCGRPPDGEGRCWRCCDRACCECGRPTGTAFVARCVACGHRFNGNRGNVAAGE